MINLVPHTRTSQLAIKFQSSSVLLSVLLYHQKYLGQLCLFVNHQCGIWECFLIEIAGVEQAGFSCNHLWNSQNVLKPDFDETRTAVSGCVKHSRSAQEGWCVIGLC